MKTDYDNIYPLVNWVFTKRGVTICRSQSGPCCSLPYPYAALWDGLSKGYRIDELTDWLSILRGIDKAAARRELVKTLQEWENEKFISWQKQ